MPAISEQDLRTQLENGTLASLYLLVGEEKLILKRAARRLIVRASGDSFPEFNRNELSGESPVERIADAAAALPFFAPHKCVAVADLDPEALPAQEMDKLLDLLDDLPETTTLVLYYPTLNIPPKSAKWKKLMDRGGKAGLTVSFARREPAELRRTILKAAEKQGCVMEKNAADRLQEYCGPDLNMLLNETNKLCAYVLGQGEGRVTPRTVEALTPKTTETATFAMVKALTAGNAQEAYTLLDEIFWQDPEPVSVLGAMSTAFIDMYRVRAALDSGLTAGAAGEYAPEYKKFSFRLRNAERSIRRTPASVLARCLDLLLEADLSIKGSRMDSRLVIEALMVRLMEAMHAAQGGQR